MRIILKIYDTTEYPKNCKTEQDVLDLFDSLPIFTDMMLAKEKLKNNEVVRFEDCLFFNLTKSGYFDKLNIVDVDTSKLWRIEEYDEAESLVYYKIGENNQLEKIE